MWGNNRTVNTTIVPVVMTSLTCVICQSTSTVNIYTNTPIHSHTLQVQPPTPTLSKLNSVLPLILTPSIVSNLLLVRCHVTSLISLRLPHVVTPHNFIPFGSKNNSFNVQPKMGFCKARNSSCCPCTVRYMHRQSVIGHVWQCTA